jgi:hypothetical protein
MRKLISNPAQDELDAIRIKLYEATKDMTKGDRVAYYKAKSQNALKGRNIKVVPNTTEYKANETRI